MQNLNIKIKKMSISVLTLSILSLVSTIILILYFSYFMYFASVISNGNSNDPSSSEWKREMQSLLSAHLIFISFVGSIAGGLWLARFVCSIILAAFVFQGKDKYLTIAILTVVSIMLGIVFPIPLVASIILIIGSGMGISKSKNINYYIDSKLQEEN